MVFWTRRDYNASMNINATIVFLNFCYLKFVMLSRTPAFHLDDNRVATGINSPSMLNKF
jgi:hypothetical protein